MRTAIADGIEIQAGPEAPATATCPACGAKVLLRRHGPTWWAYHHATPAPACLHTWRAPVEPRDWPAPEYFVAVAAIRETIKDALNGRGPQAFDWLFEPAPQAALGLLLGLDAQETWAATEEAVERLKRVIAAGQAPRLRQLVTSNAYEQVLGLLVKEM
jgi:hypothetical protein